MIEPAPLWCETAKKWVAPKWIAQTDAVNIPDPVTNPTHYNSHPSGVECIEITKHYSFLIGNVIKYVWRHKEKNGIEDLRKARWYLDLAIKEMEK